MDSQWAESLPASFAPVTRDMVGEGLDRGIPLHILASAVENQVPLDFRSLTPRYRLIREPGVRGYVVYVFTDRHVWDHIAGDRRALWAAHRLGRSAVQRVLTQSPDEADRFHEAGHRRA